MRMLYIHKWVKVKVERGGKDHEVALIDDDEQKHQKNAGELEEEEFVGNLGGDMGDEDAGVEIGRPRPDLGDEDEDVGLDECKPAA